MTANMFCFYITSLVVSRLSYMVAYSCYSENLKTKNKNEMKNKNIKQNHFLKTTGIPELSNLRININIFIERKNEKLITSKNVKAH